MKKLLLISTILALAFTTAAQDEITIGNGTYNTSYIPTPYYNDYNESSKQQYLILASELTQAGAKPGYLESIAFNVASASSGATVYNYSIYLKATSTSSLSSFESGTFDQVFSTSQYSPGIGWNEHNFSTPFYWDGQSNIVVQICNYTAYSGYYDVYSYYTNISSFTASLYYSYSYENTSVCNTSSYYTSSRRPNMKFIINSCSFTTEQNSFTGCSPFTLDFIPGNTTNVASYEWDFGDGNISYDENPTYTYENSTSFSKKYDVTLTQTYNNNTTCSTVEEVLVHPAPEADFLASPKEISLPDSTIDFAYTGSDKATTFLWNFGDGGESTKKNPTHYYTVAGIYPVTLIIFDDKGCFDIETKSNYINVHQTVGIDDPDQTFIRTYPNPAGKNAIVEVSNQNASFELTLELFDLMGKKITKPQLISKKKTTGGVIFNIKSSELISGVYFFQLFDQKEPAGSGKIVVK